MQQADTQLLVSLVSLWEIQIKTQLGKLTLQTPLAEIIAHQSAVDGAVSAALCLLPSVIMMEAAQQV